MPLNRKEQFEVIFLTGGTGICKVDLEQFSINEEYISLIRPGQVREVSFSEDAAGYIISFDKVFFQFCMDKTVLLNSGSCFSYSASCKRKLESSIRSWMEEILISLYREYNSLFTFKMEALHSLLRVFLIYIGRTSADTGVGRKNTAFVQMFFNMLEEKFSTYTKPRDYAKALSVSPSYLNGSVKKVSGFPTSYHIQQRRLMEAQRLTIYSQGRMKEVAVHLGFDDIAHFSKFFKKASGENFSEFRKKIL